MPNRLIARIIFKLVFSSSISVLYNFFWLLSESIRAGVFGCESDELAARKTTVDIWNEMVANTIRFEVKLFWITNSKRVECYELKRHFSIYYSPISPELND